MIQGSIRAEGRAQEEAGALSVFVHVPKTAGSTMNALLGAWSDAGAAHCEQVVDDPARFAAKVRGLRWISGHVPFDRFRAALTRATDRPLRFYTTVREPTAQIASHYNWLIEIFHRGRAFYEGHPEPIRRISEHIRASDNADPTVVAGNLEAYGGLFLNQQARHVLGAGFDWGSGQVAERLLAYACVGTEEGLGRVFQALTGTVPPAPRRENESGYHFDRAVFEDPGLRRFLLRRHYFDYALYDAVRRVAELRGEAPPG